MFHVVVRWGRVNCCRRLGVHLVRPTITGERHGYGPNKVVTDKGTTRQQLFIITQGNTRPEVTGHSPRAVWSPAIYTCSSRSPAPSWQKRSTSLKLQNLYSSRWFTTVLETVKGSRTFCCKGLVSSAPNLGSQQTNTSQQQQQQQKQRQVLKRVVGNSLQFKTRTGTR